MPTLLLHCVMIPGVGICLDVAGNVPHIRRYCLVSSVTVLSRAACRAIIPRVESSEEVDE